MGLSLVVGSVLLGLTTLMQTFASLVVLRLARSMIPLRQRGHRYWPGVLLLQATTFILLANALAQMVIWASVFMWCGEFDDFGDALQHSASSYTCLGDPDKMSRTWRLLSPLEAANGILMGGLAVALKFTIMTRLLKADHETKHGEGHDPLGSY